MGVTSYENLAEFLDQARDDSMLVLFRRRAEVLFASSYCSNAGVEHRLRMSDLPVVVRPWLGWLLGETIQSILSRRQFDELWETRAALAAEPFADEQRDACWSVVHRLAAGTLPNSIDLVQLRKIVARSRPPIELCYPELGSVGPILGTIHASKGREADIVVLAMPPSQDGSEEDERGESAAIFEEGRVYYVGATRARKMLVTTGNAGARVGYLDSGRVYRFAGQRRAQMEIGRDDDLDVSAHLAWSNALTTQRALARLVGHVVTAKARAMPEHDYAHRISLEHKDSSGITRSFEVGQLSISFQYDFAQLWSRVDPERKLRPAGMIPHLYMVCVSTIALTDEQQVSAKPPFSQGAMALGPVIKGFPMVQFLFRKQRQSFR